MNKSILITENKIIKEDAIEQVSSSLSFERGLSFIGDILKGVINITLRDKDTFLLKEDYFSYRRAVHNGRNDYGRQMSSIILIN